MLRRLLLLAMSVVALACWGAPLLAQQQTEPRIALVVGNSAYAPGAAPTTLNDAGLVAEALRSIGFEIVEGANLSQPDMLRTYREFLAKVEAAGPDTLAFVYFAGDAASFEGENFLLGVDARLARGSDIPIEGVRLADLLGPLAGSPARAKVMMIDATRPISFQPQGGRLAPGLEAIEPPQGVLIAYSSAPGTQAPDRPGDYGAYATAIAEMLRAPGVDLDTAFTYIRSRTHETTDGQQTPWHVSAIGEPIDLLPPQAAAAMASAPLPPLRQARPMREMRPEEAYGLAIEEDTLEGYVQFVEAYPGHPLTQRVWAMIRARREALAWMRALEVNTPRSYWTYLRRYPNGIYAFDAELRLRRLGAPFAPPPGFAMMEFDDVPMALVGEPVEYEQVYRIGPPPPRDFYRAPRPAYLAHLAPARRGVGGAAVLPVLAVAIPAVAALAPAPRRAFAPGTTRPNAFGTRQGFGNRAAPAAAPASITPNVVRPNVAVPNSAAPAFPGQGRPPEHRGPPPGVAAPAAAPNVAPNNQAVTHPPGGPQHEFVNRTPASGPAAPAPNVAAPTHQPPPEHRQSPQQQNVVAHPSPPAAPVIHPAPPPKPPGKPPGCPAGKTFKEGACK